MDHHNRSFRFRSIPFNSKSNALIVADGVNMYMEDEFSHFVSLLITTVDTALFVLSERFSVHIRAVQRTCASSRLTSGIDDGGT